MQDVKMENLGAALTNVHNPLSVDGEEIYFEIGQHHGLNKTYLEICRTRKREHKHTTGVTIIYDLPSQAKEAIEALGFKVVIV